MIKALVVGTGQGGGKIAVGYEQSEFVNIFAINSTDSDTLPDLPNDHKIYFSTGGAGQNAGTGQRLFAENYDLVEEKLLTKIKQAEKPQVVFVSASLGGGTGSGTVGQLADILKFEFPDVPIIGVVSLPENAFLNPNSAANVIIAMENLKEAKALDATVFWDNNKIMAREIQLAKMNKITWGPIKRFIKYVGYSSSIRTLDTADFGSLVGHGGSLTFFDTNLPMAMGNIDEIISKVRETWATNYYPSELKDNIYSAGGLGLIVVVPDTDQNKERMFNQLNSRISEMFSQRTVKVSGFFVDPELPSSQFKILTALAGLPYPDQRLSEIVNIAKTKRTFVETPDLVSEDTELVNIIGNNLGNRSAQRRADNKLAGIFSPDTTPKREAPALRNRRRS